MCTWVFQVFYYTGSQRRTEYLRYYKNSIYNRTRLFYLLILIRKWDLTKESTHNHYNKQPVKEFCPCNECYSLPRFSRKMQRLIIIKALKFVNLLERTSSFSFSWASLFMFRDRFVKVYQRLVCRVGYFLAFFLSRSYYTHWD